MTQLTIDQAAGDQAKADGMAQAESHADATWKAEALAAIRRTAQAHAFFNSSQVWESIQTQTHEPRAMGALMREAKKQGWIVPTETFVMSDRPSQHRQPLRVWKSMVYERNA